MYPFLITTILLFLILYLFINVPICWESKGPRYKIYNYLKNQVVKKLHKLGWVKFNKRKGYEMLAIIHDVCEGAGIGFWLSEGTALGFKRDGDFIDWDDDLDIGIRAEDKNLFLNLLPAKGFVLCEVSLNNSFYSYLYKNEKLDVDVTGRNLQCRANSNKLNGAPCEELLPHLQSFDKLEIMGKVYNLPRTSYLELLYGKQWQTPVKGFKPK